MTKRRISKRLIDSIQPVIKEETIWDADLPGFGVRVRPSGAKSYIVVYRAGRSRSSPVRKMTIGAVGKLTPDEARELARRAIGSIAHGKDPATEKKSARKAMTVAELAELFLAEHVRGKRKAGTFKKYEHVLRKHILPEIGCEKINHLTNSHMAQVHLNLT